MSGEVQQPLMHSLPQISPCSAPVAFPIPSIGPWWGIFSSPGEISRPETPQPVRHHPCRWTKLPGPIKKTPVVETPSPEETELQPCQPMLRPLCKKPVVAVKPMPSPSELHRPCPCEEATPAPVSPEAATSSPFPSQPELIESPSPDSSAPLASLPWLSEIPKVSVSSPSPSVPEESPPASPPLTSPEEVKFEEDEPHPCEQVAESHPPEAEALQLEAAAAGSPDPSSEASQGVHESEEEDVSPDVVLDRGGVPSVTGATTTAVHDAKRSSVDEHEQLMFSVA